MSAIPDNFTGLVQFSANWCQPCKVLTPVLEKFSEETGTAIHKVDVDDYPDLADQFAIRGVPTVISFKDGNVLESVSGANAAERYHQMIEKFRD